MSVIAIDVAILPPPDIARRAIELSAALPRKSFKGLRLDGEHRPHITLSQQFVRANELAAALREIDRALEGQAPLPLSASGPGRNNNTVWIAIARTKALHTLHERVMAALRPFEQTDGGADAFADGDARPGDIGWVSGYRAQSSFDAFTPHITLGHADSLPRFAPQEFQATSIAVCHLGRFCTCRRILQEWTLKTLNDK